MVCQIDDNDLMQLTVTPGSGSAPATWKLDGNLSSADFPNGNGDYLLTVTALTDSGAGSSTTCTITVKGL
jgi:hypothetical protein